MLSKKLKDPKQKKIEKKKVLLIGAGGIGCELLKCLVMIGVKNISIIDLDTVERSNLNRQFLFGDESIGKYKSEMAKKSIEKLTSIQDLKIDSFIGNVKDFNKFPFDFFKSFDCVLNALDNIDARSYVNRICFFNEIPLINSGTEGFLGTCNCFKGKSTACFDCTPKIKQKTIPLCSIRSKPEKIEHCIAWGKALFEMLLPSNEENPISDYFEKLKNGKEILENFDKFFNDLFSEGSKLEKNEKKSISFENEKTEKNEIINFEFFDKAINYNISFSDDLFKFDNEENIDIKNIFELFIGSFILLELKYNLKTNLFESYLCKLKDKSEKINFKNSKNKNFDFIKCFFSDENYKKEEIIKIDKEEDLILNFIFASSIMRAIHFDIPTVNRFKVKDIVGNIVPAIASTNSIIASIQAMEVLKVLSDDEYLNVLKNTSFNREKMIRSESSKNNIANENCNVCSSNNIITEIELNPFEFCLADLIEISRKELEIERPIIYKNKTLIFDYDEFVEELGNSSLLNKTFSELNIENNNRIKLENFENDLSFSIIFEVKENKEIGAKYKIKDLGFIKNHKIEIIEKNKKRKEKEIEANKIKTNNDIILFLDEEEEKATKSNIEEENIKKKQRGILYKNNEEINLLGKKRKTE